MIRKIHIQGFKSLPDVKLDLGRVNVFIGANGSGKSNILEAIGILGAAASGSVETESIRYRGVRLGLPKLYKSSFKNSRIRPEIGIEASRIKDNYDSSYKVCLGNPIDDPKPNWRFKLETLKTNPLPNGDELTFLSRGWKVGECKVTPGAKETPVTVVDKDRYRGLARFSLAYFASTRVRSSNEDEKNEVKIGGDYDSANRLLDLLENYAIYTPITDVLRGEVEDKIARQPLGLRGGGLALAVRKLFQDRILEHDEIIELIDWAESINVLPTFQIPIFPSVPIGRINLSFRDRYMVKDRNTLSAYDASEGALYVLFMLTLASHPESPKFFAVDNFDHAIHPLLGRKLMETLCEYVIEKEERQLLLTTHNPLVLDGLDITNDDIRLFTVDRTAKGFTDVQRVQLTPELAKEKKDLSLSRLWIMRRLGGVPKNLI